MNQTYEDPSGLLEFSGCLRQIILLIVIGVVGIIFIAGMVTGVIILAFF